jgi:chromosome segregation protein
MSKTWTSRITAAAERVGRLLERRSAAAAEALAAKTRPEQLAAEIDTLSAEVATLEAERQKSADRLAEKEAAIREANLAPAAPLPPRPKRANPSPAGK